GARASLCSPQRHRVQPPLPASHPGDPGDPDHSLGTGARPPVSRWIGLAVAALLAIALGTAVGAFPVSLSDVGAALAGRGEPATISIVRDLRLPRALLAFLVGGSLAVCGASLQAVV